MIALDKQVTPNQGVFSVVDIKTRKGSIVDPVKPAATAARRDGIVSGVAASSIATSSGSSGTETCSGTGTCSGTFAFGVSSTSSSRRASGPGVSGSLRSLSHSVSLAMAASVSAAAARRASSRRSSADASAGVGYVTPEAVRLGKTEPCAGVEASFHATFSVAGISTGIFVSALVLFVGAGEMAESATSSLECTDANHERTSSITSSSEGDEDATRDEGGFVSSIGASVGVFGADR